MRNRPTETTLRGRLVRRLLVTLALALVMTSATAGAALASGHASTQGRSAPAAALTESPPEPASDQSSSSPMIVLVFAGILILAVASPALPRYSRYGYYRGERR